jgi:hypothetical protein
MCIKVKVHSNITYNDTVTYILYFDFEFVKILSLPFTRKFPQFYEL